MSTPLPDLQKLNQRLADHSQRVNDVMDSLMGSVDALSAAASQREWNEVLRITKEIKLHGVKHGLGVMAEAAEDLLRSLPSGNESDSMRRVVRLIGAAGRVQRPVSANP